MNNKLIRLSFILAMLFVQTVLLHAQQLTVIEKNPLSILTGDQSTLSNRIYFKADNLRDTLKMKITGTDASYFSLNKSYSVAQNNVIVLDSLQLNFTTSDLGEHAALLNFSVKDSVYVQFTLNGLSNGAVTVESLSESMNLKNIKVQDGFITFMSDKLGDAEVFTPKGELVYSTKIKVGENKLLKLNKGLWILRLNSEIYKFKI